MTLNSDKPSMNTDSPLILFFRHLLTLVALNLSFICLSLPVLTIVCASVALTGSIEHVKNDERFKSVMHAFFHTFLNVWKEASLIGIPLVLSLALMIYVMISYYLMALENPFFYILFFLILFISIFLIGIIYHVVIMLAFVKLKKKDMMRNALILWVMYPIRTLMSSFLFILPVLILVWWLFLATPIVLTIGFSGTFFVMSWVHRPLTKSLVKNP